MRRRILIALAMVACIAATPTVPYFTWWDPGNPLGMVNTLIQYINQAFSAAVGVSSITIVGCTNSADDSPILNDALNQAYNASNNSSVTIDGHNQSCKVMKPLDASGMQGSPVTIENLSLNCFTTGLPCVWALGSPKLNLIKFRMFGNSGSIPSYGIVRGKYDPGGTFTINQMGIGNSLMLGFYSGAVVYDVGSENTSCYNSLFQNQATTAGAYAWVLDGINHFNVATPAGMRVSQGLSADTNVPGGMHSIGAFNCSVINRDTTAGTAALWMAGAEGVDFEDSYIASYGPTTAVDLYEFSSGLGDQNWNIHCECHIETTSVAEDWLLTGGNATPTVQGFFWHDQSPNTAGSLLALDTGVTGATFLSFNLRVWKATPAGTPPVFDAAANYSLYDADVYVPASGWWTTPGTFFGCYTLGAAERTCKQNSSP